MTDPHATGSRAATRRNPMLTPQRIVDCVVESLMQHQGCRIQIPDDALQDAYWVALRVLSSEFGPGWAAHLREREDG